MFARNDLYRRLVLLACGLAAVGCSHRQSGVTAAPPAVKPATQPVYAGAFTARTQTFSSAGIAFDYPADWKSQKGQTAVFAITAPPARSVCASMSLDIPKLPASAVVFIPMGLVCNGYIKDLKNNQLHDAVVKEQTALSVPNSSARRITCCGKKDGRPSTDVAVILIHADRVYILSADSDPNGDDCARKALDAAVASLRWTN